MAKAPKLSKQTKVFNLGFAARCPVFAKQPDKAVEVGTKTQFSINLKLILATILMLGAAFVTNICRANIDQKKLLSLPAQELSTSLRDLGIVFNLSIIYPANALKGLSAEPLNGQYSPREAVEKLLINTRFSSKIINNQVVAIVPRTSELSPQEQEYIQPTFYEEVTVYDKPILGSRIGEHNFNASAPVTVITAPELRATGAQTLIEFLKFNPAVAGNSTSTTVSNGGDGSATVTLRGLPANNTLVLINGHRVAFNGLAGDSVDLNTISPNAIERVEILTDGASALYGSDAIAGVVNIVLRDEFEGVQVEQYYGESSRSDLETTTTSLLAGRKWGNLSLLVAASTYEQEGLFSRERDFSATADARSQGGIDLRSSSTPNARIRLNNDQVVTFNESGVPLANNGNVNDVIQVDDLGDFREATDEDLFDFNQFTSSTSPSERDNIYLAGKYDIDEFTQIKANASYANTKATITLAPLPLFSSFENPPITVSAGNIFNPFNQEITDIRRRFTELGSREQINESDVYRYSFGINGANELFDWSLNTFWTRTASTQTRTGLVDAERLARAVGPADQCQGIDRDGCVPVDLFGPSGSITQDQLDYIGLQERSRGTSDLRGINTELQGSTSIFPAGTSRYAIGFEWRYERTRLAVDSTNDSTEYVGGNETQSVNGKRTIGEGYFEWHIPVLANGPLVDSVDLELAARLSRYSDFGYNSSPKLGIKIRPNQNVLLRSTFGRGFRAPSISEQRIEGFQSQSFLVDPCSIAENVGVLPGCNQLSDVTRNQFQTTFVSDNNLKPEKSENITLGFVLTPEAFPGWRFSFDWFRIDQKDIIDTNPQALVDLNAKTNEFQDLIIRDERGNISEIITPAVNLGTRTVVGLDISWRYIVETEKYGAFALNGNAVNLRKYRQQQSSNNEPEDLAGIFTDSSSQGTGALPEWKASTNLEWTKNHWQINYGINFIDSMTEAIPRTDSTRKINSWLTHNAQASYKFKNLSGLTASLGVENIFDKEPPFVASALTDNFDGFAYNPKQRFFYSRITYFF